MTSRSESAANVRSWVLAVAVVALLAGLPVAVWLDLRSLSENALHTQASDLNAIISGVRDYYASNVVGRVLAAHSATTQVVHNYEDVPGAIPIPATLSLELGDVVSTRQSNITYRFISDYPFKERAPHPMDGFERDALVSLRSNPHRQIASASTSLLSERVRIVTPILMEAACVACHNSRPDSPKRDWKVGDVRGIQEVTIVQPIAANLFSFKYLLLYFIFTAAVGLGFIAVQRNQARVIAAVNRNLEAANDFLAAVSLKISRYLPPQIYKSIFSGEKDAAIHTERKRLTIFFSDIKDFTATTERLQPEVVTALLNEYFTEMSAIAARHGGTVDKFIGDAMLIFFGDPETKGVQEDAKACVRMAVEMQQRVAALNLKWRNDGIEQPFRIRMGINTGFCNVGNFGSADRMDYTIIGAAANLTARLEAIAEPGQIVISYETYVLVRDLVATEKLAPITMKGITGAVVPYTVTGLLGAGAPTARVISEHLAGVDFDFDPNLVETGNAARIEAVLRAAMAALEARKSSPA